ncbi:MAG: hypothetical protein H8E25_07735 [Planctomycetes bacterium]|nr:hypothetical protein [Planctomycetota bacterium]
MNKLLTIIIIIAVAAVMYCPPSFSGELVGSQAIAAQGGGGGVVGPPFPFGMAHKPVPSDGPRHRFYAYLRNNVGIDSPVISTP